jgi:hypothetical protein
MLMAVVTSGGSCGVKLRSNVHELTIRYRAAYQSVGTVISLRCRGTEARLE